MPFYRERVYPLLVDALGNPGPVRKLRGELVPLASGTVLEIGVGSGTNFQYYDPERVSLLYALEPNPGMLSRARAERLRSRLPVEFIDLPAGRLPLADATVDTVVSTFTLCTIAGIAEALRGIARALKPGGRLLFLELSRASDIRIRRWQERWEPIHRRLFAGLYLTRDIPALLEVEGLHVERLASIDLTPFPRSWGHCCLGTAVRGSELGDS